MLKKGGQLGLGSGIRKKTYPGSRIRVQGQKGTGSRIPDRKTCSSAKKPFVLMGLLVVDRYRYAAEPNKCGIRAHEYRYVSVLSDRYGNGMLRYGILRRVM
jgi:hypothetical protein